MVVCFYKSTNFYLQFQIKRQCILFIFIDAFVFVILIAKFATYIQKCLKKILVIKKYERKHRQKNDSKILAV